MAEGLAILAGAYQPGQPVDAAQMARVIGGRMDNDALAAVIFGPVVDAAPPGVADAIAATQPSTGRKRGRPRKARLNVPPARAAADVVQAKAMPSGSASDRSTPVSEAAGLNDWITDADLDALPEQDRQDGARVGAAGTVSGGVLAGVLGHAPLALSGDALLALDALREIAQDPEASGAARASAARALLEMSGALGKHQRPPPPPEDELLAADVDLAAMSLAELKTFFLRCCGHELKQLRAENHELRQRVSLLEGNKSAV